MKTKSIRLACLLAALFALPTALAVGSLGWSPDSARLYVLAPGHRLFYWALTDLRQELAKRGLDW